MPKAVYRSSCRDKHSHQQRDSNLGPLTPHSAITHRIQRIATTWILQQLAASPTRICALSKWRLDQLRRVCTTSFLHMSHVAVCVSVHATRLNRSRCCWRADSCGLKTLSIRWSPNLSRKGQVYGSFAWDQIRT